MTIEEKLRRMGLELPPPFELPPGVRINFRLARPSGNLLYLSGQGPLMGREVVYKGKVGSDLTVEQGYEAAKLTALNVLRLIKDEIGDLDSVKGWVKVLGFVNSAPEFTQQPAVLNGFSDLIVELYGPERGLHARSAIGLANLPFDQAVEVEAIIEIGEP